MKLSERFHQFPRINDPKSLIELFVCVISIVDRRCVFFENVSIILNSFQFDVFYFTSFDP